MVLLLAFGLNAGHSGRKLVRTRSGDEIEHIAQEFMKDPAYRKEYDALEEEFALMAAVAKARLRSGLSYPQLVRRMKTTPRTMTRLENGRDVSIQTLSRFAKATGHRLKISFEPVKVKKGGRARELTFYACK